MQFYWADGFAVKNNSRKLSGIPFAFDLNPSRGYFQLFLHLINVLSIVNARKFISRSPHCDHFEGFVSESGEFVET